MSYLRVGPQDVGRRVVVRRQLADGAATDLLGELLRCDGQGMTLLPDDGPAVQVVGTDVLAAKVVPSRQVRPSSSIADVARVHVLGWPGLERERLGGWVLRAAQGFTGRANCALPLGDPGMPLERAVDAVEAFYGARGLAPRVCVPFSLDLSTRQDPAPGLDAVLARRGWTVDGPTLVLTATLRGDRQQLHPRGGDVVEVADEPDEDWLSLYRYRGGALPPVARQVLLAAPQQEFVTVRRQGQAVACGRLAVAQGWAGVTAMQVADHARRQGLGSLVLDALLGRGAALGARFGYLQVAAANTAATGMYGAMGFTAHHGYHYRTMETVGQAAGHPMPVQVTRSSGL